MIFFHHALFQIILSIALLAIPACIHQKQNIEKKTMSQPNSSFDIIPASQEEADLVDNKITEFINSKIPFTQNSNPILKNYIIKDNEEIIAGIKADIYYWRILYIEALFIDERYRGQHLGSSLLAHAENEAKAMGATLVHLDTFDFQAKDFYLKNGYEIFGILEDCPKGHKRYYMKKYL